MEQSRYKREDVEFIGLDMKFSPIVKSRLLINEKAIVISCPSPIPNWWHRLWYKLLLGWKWEKVRE